ncbi:MAG: efflux transporter outer membrane subunit [Desulfobulbaceae bacterium]|nr:efflux transporter outer membrane subunit [Desulfobulbaceae bacterium]
MNMRIKHTINLKRLHRSPDRYAMSRPGRGKVFAVDRNILRAFTLSSLLALAGCAPVGPDYMPPEKNVPAAWHTELRQGLSAENIDPGQLTGWWSILEDPVLSGLIEQAAANNLDMKQAVARVREARARRGISATALFPAVDAGGSASRSKGSENTGSGATRSFYSVGFDAGWEVDIFGGVRRSVEAAEADLEAGRENLRDVLVSLTAEVALNYLDLQTTHKRLAAAEKNLAIQQESYDFIDWRYQAGMSNVLELQQARYNLENTRAQVPNLRSGIEEAKNRLAVLVGGFPGSVHELLAEPQQIPAIPPATAVGIPAETLLQRPDIRRAERNLAAQTARIGAATADLYPRFRLSGSIGLEALDSADLFTSGSDTWSIIPGFSWKIFDAGAIRRNIEVQSAVQEQFLLAYEAAILGALEEVENALTAYAEEQLRREHLAAAVDAARQAEELAGQQYEAGLVDFNTVLDAQRSLLSFEDQLAQSDGTVTANLVRLYKALGGGWNSLAVQ